MNTKAPFQTECTVSGALSFVLRLSRLVGIAPLRFESVRGGSRIRVSRIYRFYGQVLTIVFLLFSVVALTADLTIDRKTSFRVSTNANRFVWISDIFVVGMVVFTAAHTGVNRMHHMINCLAQLQQINKEMSSYQEPSYPSETKKLIIVIFLIVLGCFTIFTDYGIFMIEVINMNGKVLSSSFYVFYNISSVVLELVVIQFTLIAISVLPTMQLLNSCLKTLLQKIYKDIDSCKIPSTNVVHHQLNCCSHNLGILLIPQDGQTSWMECALNTIQGQNCLKPSASSLAASFPKATFFNKDSQANMYNRITRKSLTQVMDSMTVNVNAGGNTTPVTLHRLAACYCALCDVVRHLDESNGFILVLLFLSFLLHLIITPYHLITGLFHSEESDHSSVLMQVAWAVYHICKLTMIIEPCHRTHEQMAQTRNLINKMRRYTPPEDYAVVSELKMFYRHLMLNQVAYSPMQFFTLNRTLIAAIMGSITTYLVVVIQL